MAGKELGAAAVPGAPAGTASGSGLAAGATAGPAAGRGDQQWGRRQRQLLQQPAHPKHHRPHAHDAGQGQHQRQQQSQGQAVPHPSAGSVKHFHSKGGSVHQHQLAGSEPGGEAKGSEQPPVASGSAVQAAAPSEPLQPQVAAGGAPPTQTSSSGGQQPSPTNSSGQQPPQADNSQLQPPQANSSQPQSPTNMAHCGDSSRAQALSWPNHTFWLTHKQRVQGVTYIGPNERLRLVLQRAMAGANVVMSSVGGSIAAGNGCTEQFPAYPVLFERWLAKALKPYGSNVTLNNGAMPGTTSDYMSSCFNLHVPLHADIVFLEYTINDRYIADPPYDNEVRRPYERLIRKLLMLPNAPAVILVHSYAWFAPPPSGTNFKDGLYFNSIEYELDEFGRYYDLPAISVKSCCYHAMREGWPGFKVHVVSADDPRAVGDVFYMDRIHPHGKTGHLAYLDMLIHLFTATMEDLVERPAAQEDKEVVEGPLPPPMIPGNYASLTNRCLIGPAFELEAVADTGDGAWVWVNESPTPRPKWGMVSNASGSVIKLRVNTTAAVGSGSDSVLVQLVHLKSYQHMGTGVVRCLSGCTCQESTLDGHWEDRSSQLMMHNFYVSQAPECIISVMVGNATRSGEHKVKLAGIIVNEQSGQSLGVTNSEAIEYVHDISHHTAGFGVNGSFDVRNHVRRLLTGWARYWQHR